MLMAFSAASAVHPRFNRWSLSFAGPWRSLMVPVVEMMTVNLFSAAPLKTEDERLSLLIFGKVNKWLSLRSP